jgi:hypothetical protein
VSFNHYIDGGGSFLSKEEPADSIPYIVAEPEPVTICGNQKDKDLCERHTGYYTVIYSESN